MVVAIYRIDRHSSIGGISQLFGKTTTRSGFSISHDLTCLIELNVVQITGISRQLWEDLEYQLARFWFQDIMRDMFLNHYVCAECVNHNCCEYWEEAIHCYWNGDINENEVIEEFRRNCEDSYRAYALAQMNEWQKHTLFTHEHGKRIHRLWGCSV